MRPEERTALHLALGLAAMAGCVDSIAFLSLHGFFASFMSGNSTRLAIGLADGNERTVLVAAALIVLFVAGVTAGRLVAARRRVLAMVAAMLVLSALSATVPTGPAERLVPILFAVPALGAANNVVQQAGKFSLTATYITGTLVRMGQAIGTALTGGARWEWAPYALLWSSLMAGAVVGAALFPRVGGLRALWLPAVWCGVLWLAIPNSDPVGGDVRTS